MTAMWLFLAMLYALNLPSSSNTEQQCGRRNYVGNGNVVHPADALGPLKFIEGGEVVNQIEKWPWMAQIRIDVRVKQDPCTASLIGKRWLLTAAHCSILGSYTFRHGDGEITMNLSKNDFTIVVNHLVPYPEVDEKPAVASAIKEIITHPDYVYERDKNMHDIAIIELESDIENAMPICLSASNRYAVNGTEAYILGYAHFEPLKEARVPIVSNPQCDKEMSETGAENIHFLCAGGQPGVDTCTGDSGGPLIVYDEAANRFVQVGITSHGPKDGSCGQEGKYGKYVRISAYCDFIKSTTRGEVECGL